MRKQNHSLLLFMFIVIAIGLLSALMPAVDLDDDGAWDSLVTEGSLLALIHSTSAEIHHLSIRFAPMRLASPWLFSSSLILPPITIS